MKVWLYYRLSRDEDKELNSLSNQRNIIYHYAITNGHEVVGELNLQDVLSFRVGALNNSVPWRMECI